MTSIFFIFILFFVNTNFKPAKVHFICKQFATEDYFLSHFGLHDFTTFIYSQLPKKRKA